MIHPVAVATILADLRLDAGGIIAALLHDVIEDTGIVKEQIAAQFGEKIAELVDGVSKLTQIKVENRAEVQAENFRKMILAMVQDIRVILVKLADRLHNMRTLDHMPYDRQVRKAHETLKFTPQLQIASECMNFEWNLRNAALKPFIPYVIGR